MNKILDLSVFSEDTLDITMPDGYLLHVKKPTQSIVISMMELSQEKDREPAQMIEKLNELCVKILNNNKEGRNFTCEEVSMNLEFPLITAIIQAYTDFTKEIQSNPT